MPSSLDVVKEISPAVVQFQRSLDGKEDLESTMQVASEPLSEAGEFRKKRKALKAAGLKITSNFVTTPGALSSDDRDASKHQGKFDMGALYQAQLESDKFCMIVDFYKSRIVFSNALCDSLFQTLSPLPQRDITDLVFEDDKVNFSSAVMYLSIGKKTYLEPQKIRVDTAQGVRFAMISASQLADPLWRVDLHLVDEGELVVNDAANVCPDSEGFVHSC